MSRTNHFLRTLFIYNGIFVFASGLIGPLYAVYVQKFDSKVSSISLSWGIFLISTTFFLFLLSRFGDQLKNKKALLMAGFAIRAISWVSYIFVGDLTGLILVQILLGIGEALGTPSFEALFAEHLDRGKHIMNYSEWKLIVNATSAIAVIFGGFFIDKFGFNYLFIFMSIMALISFWGVLVHRDSRELETKDTSNS